MHQNAPNRIWATYLTTWNDLVAPLLVAVVVLVILILIASRLALKKITLQQSLLVIAFALLGGISGTIAGASSEPIVGAMLTAILGVVSAALSFLLGKDSVAALRDFLPFVIIGLILAALAGLVVGRAYKVRWDEYEVAMKKHMLEYEQVYIPITVKTRQINELCLKALTEQDDIVECEKSVIAK
jgi:predicted neutral ceramidase superfamily lipid hydrolase